MEVVGAVFSYHEILALILATEILCNGTWRPRWRFILTPDMKFAAG